MTPTSPSGTPDRDTLAGALDAIAAGAARAQAVREVADAGLAIGDVQAAARRRRVRFGAGVGLAAATVVGALVLGGAALTRADRPEPPAETTGPAPTPAVHGCGTLVSDHEFLNSSLVIDLILDPESWEVRTGEPVSGQVVVADAGGGELDPADLPADLADAVQYWLVSDAGQVIATGTNHSDDPQGLSGRLGSTTPLALDLRGCGGGGPPQGDFSLMAVLPASAITPGLDGLLTTARVPLTVTAPDAVVADLPACGTAVQWLGSGPPLVADARVQVGRLDADSGGFVHEGYGDALSIEVSVTNEGPDLFDATGIRVDAVVVRDQVVVAQLPGEHSDPAPEDWPTGGMRNAGLAALPQRCDGAGEALPPGDYQLWTRIWTRGGAGPDSQSATYVAGVGHIWFTVYAAEDPELYGPVTYTTDGEAGWSDVDISAVPTDVPLALDGSDAAIRVRAYEDGHRWDVSVYFETSADRAYANARAALTAAGFAVVDEDPDIAPDGWAWGDFTRDDLRVHVDTNTTGAGWFGDYLIVRTT